MTLVAIIAIIIPFAYSILNIYAAEQLQFRWGEQNRFNYFELSNSLKTVKILPVKISFEREEDRCLVTEEYSSELVVIDDPSKISSSQTRSTY